MAGRVWIPRRPHERPAQEAIVTDLQETVGAVKEEAAKGIPNNPRINQLRVPIFGFSRRQLELETEWLQERGYSR